MKLFSQLPRARRLAPDSAFTMVEIALSLAVIGFAIVAILGVLPIGMDVQKNNRRETIVNQDANYLVEAIRGGARGLDDLTNYVIAVTNYWARYSAASGTPVVTNYDGYSTTSFYVTSVNAGTTNYSLTNGLKIIGVLSTPKFTTDNFDPAPIGPGAFQSNYVVAYIRAISGAATEKFPQTNDIVREMAFSYRLVSELLPLRGGGATNPLVGFFHPSWTNFADVTIVTNNAQDRAHVLTAVDNWAASIKAGTNANPDVVHYLTNNQPAYLPPISVNSIDLPAFRETANRWLVSRSLEPNLYDLRFLFRWPLLPRNQLGTKRQVYRTMLNCSVTNDPAGSPLWYMRSQTFLKVP